MINHFSEHFYAIVDVLARRGLILIIQRNNGDLLDASATIDRCCSAGPTEIRCVARFPGIYNSPLALASKTPHSKIPRAPNSVKKKIDDEERKKRGGSRKRRRESDRKRTKKNHSKHHTFSLSYQVQSL